MAKLSNVQMAALIFLPSLKVITRKSQKRFLVCLESYKSPGSRLVLAFGVVWFLGPQENLPLSQNTLKAGFLTLSSWLTPLGTMAHLDIYPDLYEFVEME